MVTRDRHDRVSLETPESEPQAAAADVPVAMEEELSSA